jgi:hypothetical protein
VTHPAQRAPDRQPELAGKIVGLIEAALNRPERMQRHRDDGVGAGEQVPPGLAQQRGERRGEHAPALILEGMDDLPERAVIPAGTASDGQPRGLAPAARAERAVAAKIAQRVTAPDTARRDELRHRAPAPATHRTGERLGKRVAARRARRREQDPDDRVCRERDHAPDQCKARAITIPPDPARQRSEYADFSK